MGEPKKFSFGFSKVLKKPSLIPSKAVEQVEYIKCVEDKTVKLVNEEANKPKPLPLIPMPPGSSVRDRILEAIKAREEAKSGSKEKGRIEENGGKVEVEECYKMSGPAANDAQSDEKSKLKTANGSETEPLTLDEMAAKELLESAKMDATEEKKPDLVITGTSDDTTKKESTLDDYEDMPIGDFGLAMLRGMGWDPKKGIGLNEKVVTPAAPQVRPKGMGLGADKALAAQTPQSKSAEELVMKKGSMLKVIAGPHIGLYGKIEGFEELPGRISVRLALSNSVVSLSEFMVHLVGPTEYAKNAKVMNLEKYNAALDPDSKPSIAIVKSEKPKYRPTSPPASSRRRSRSHSPSENREKSSLNSKPKKRDHSRGRTSSYKKDNAGSDSFDSDDYRRKKEEGRPHKHSNKSKYRSDSSDTDYRPKKKSSRDKERAKYSKHKSYKSESDSDSKGRHHKKHKKGRKH